MKPIIVGLQIACAAMLLWGVLLFTAHPKEAVSGAKNAPPTPSAQPVQGACNVDALLAKLAELTPKVDALHADLLKLRVDDPNAAAVLAEYDRHAVILLKEVQELIRRFAPY